MNKEDLKIGLNVSFHKLKDGKCVGLEEEVLTIVAINHDDWGVCNCKLSNDVFTNHEAIEPVEIKKRQLTIFDFI